MNKIKEQFLISKIKKGDKQAFRKIYQTFSDKIYRFIFFRLPNQDDALDATQEVFLNLWDYLTKDKDREIKNLKAFLYQISKNLIATYYYERQRRGPKTIDLELVEYKLKDQGKDLEEIADTNKDVRLIYEKLDKLEIEEYREVIKLRFLDGLSHKEIGRLLNKSEGNVRVLLHRAIKKLQLMVNE